MRLTNKPAFVLFTAVMLFALNAAAAAWSSWGMINELETDGGGAYRVYFRT